MGREFTMEMLSLIASPLARRSKVSLRGHWGGTVPGAALACGSIKMFSKKPSGENAGYAEVTAGSRQRTGLRASGDFRLTESISARVSGVFKWQDGYVDQLDFGCVHPAGSDALNPAGGIPRTTLSDHRAACVRWTPFPRIRCSTPDWPGATSTKTSTPRSRPPI